MEVKGDSVSMLTLLLHLKARAASPGLGLVAREVALDIAEAVYSPDVASHTPGIAHKLADALSRRFMPQKEGKVWEIPSVLQQVPEVEAPVRSPDFWRCLHPPSAAELLAARQAKRDSGGAAKPRV